MSVEASKTRDQLWVSVWKNGYRACYAREATNHMLRRWSVMDVVSRSAIAITAPTSAIAGWTLWSTDGGKAFWAVTAAVASVIAIFCGVIGAQERIKAYSELRVLFSRLCEEFSSLLDDMERNPQFDIPQIDARYEKCRASYSEFIAMFPADIFLTRATENRVQDYVDQRYNK